MICLMGQMQKIRGEAVDKAYFHSETFINLESTNVKEFLFLMLKQIFNNISIYQKKIRLVF